MISKNLPQSERNPSFESWERLKILSFCRSPARNAPCYLPMSSSHWSVGQKGKQLIQNQKKKFEIVWKGERGAAAGPASLGFCLWNIQVKIGFLVRSFHLQSSGLPAHPLHPPAIGRHHIEHIKQHPFHLFSYASTSFCYILQVLLMVMLTKSLIKKQTIIDAIYLIDCKFGHHKYVPLNFIDLEPFLWI